MLAEIGPFQALLDAIGWVLAWVYSLIPNYGLAIIVLTLIIRLVLVPLGIKQIKSMQHMQALQPRIKELQKKYKNNKAKQQEETMKLYKEAGVNPLGGCLPLILQFPILIAMYAVIRPPTLSPAPDQTGAYEMHNNHLPTDSALFANVINHQDTDFLWMNLQCTVLGAGQQVELRDSEGNPLPNGAQILNDDGQPLPTDPQPTTKSHLDCGTSRFPDIIPYALLLGLMVASTFYQQRQMQKASPPGSQSSQPQAIMKIFPLFFAFLGLSFPSGLVLYWTVSNGFQIAQQGFLLRAGHIGPDALDRRIAEQRARQAARADQPQKQGFMARMMERADQAQQNRDGEKGSRKPPAGGTGPRKPGNPKGRPSGGQGRGRQQPPKKPKGDGSG
jgi:YidC/Oxa1 family membrane protein insertase